MTESNSNGEPKKRIAALDLGTNSFHVVIVDIYPDGSFRTVDKLKEMVILAEKGMRHRLSEDAIERGVSALKKIKILCDSQGVEQILAYATSAIREATNGGEFIQRVIDEVGIKTLAISGKREAELIGHAVKHAVSFGGETVLMMDIGGGSVEFIVADKDTIFYSASKKIGVARMAAAFVDQDPISEQEIQRLRRHYREQLQDLFEFLKNHRIRTVIGSSGTMENIAQMVANKHSITASVSLNELIFTTGEYRKFHTSFIGLNREQRLQKEGLEEKRVDIIAPGLVLLDFVIEQCAIERVKISESALREGMILDYIRKEKEALELEQSIPFFKGPRQRSVFELLRKCAWHRKHSTHVAEMALQMFDLLQADLELKDVDRELLEYACYMHDIGYYLSHRKHHKHALYIIRHADLKGFQEDEINVMANVARYHRRSSPKNRHKRYRELDEPLKDTVRKLSAILRVADGLDRSHYQNVKNLEIIKGVDSITFTLTTEGDPELEIWGAMRKSHLFEEVTGKTLHIYSRQADEVAEMEPPEAPGEQEP